MIRDLAVLLPVYKYVEDTNIFDIIAHNEVSDCLQNAVEQAVTWTIENDIQINVARTNEMILSTARNPREFSPILINERVHSKLNGVY